MNEHGRRHKTTEYQLSVAAIYLLWGEEIKKKYSYSVIPTGIKKFEAEGFITISSEGDVDPTEKLTKLTRLKFLAQQDQIRNDPARDLNRGIESFEPPKKSRKTA